MFLGLQNLNMTKSTMKLPHTVCSLGVRFQVF